MNETLQEFALVTVMSTSPSPSASMIPNPRRYAPTAMTTGASKRPLSLPKTLKLVAENVAGLTARLNVTEIDPPRAALLAFRVGCVVVTLNCESVSCAEHRESRNAENAAKDSELVRIVFTRKE